MLACTRIWLPVSHGAAAKHYNCRLEQACSPHYCQAYTKDERERNDNSSILSACSVLWRQSNLDGGGGASKAIEQLLQSSFELDLQEGDLAPVQIWDLIRSQPLPSVTAECLGQVTAELCKHTLRLGQVI
jgi:hypothetical protein